MQLAPGWSIEKVERAVDSYSTVDLHAFVRARYIALFFEPLSTLETQSFDKKESFRTGNELIEYWQFGFAITSLCCLLAETLQCYRIGIPSSHRHELKNLHEEFISQFAIYPQYQVPDTEWPSEVGEVFRCFFAQNQALFPGINGEDFYRNIRNGLLHQAQTKHGRRIGISGDLWSTDKLNRVKLREQLKTYFDSYLAELKSLERDTDVWDRARRKIWWLVQLSKP